MRMAFGGSDMSSVNSYKDLHIDMALLSETSETS
jgi:hypothetical protein